MKGKIRETWQMTKKGHQKLLAVKMEFVPEKTSFRNLDPWKTFPSPQTRRQVSATGSLEHL